MNGGKFFFFSLIILSVVMGHNWLKNRPKPQKKPKKPPQAVNLDDLEITRPTGPISPPAASTTASEPENAPSEALASETPEVPPDEANPASAPVEVASTPTPLDGDPVLFAFRNLRRNPFETSPFAAMRAAAGKPANTENPEEEVPVKIFTVLSAPFTGTIETSKETVAILKQRLVREGEKYEEKTIKKIGKSLITLEDASGTYFIPKNGWTVQVSSEGAPILTDTLLKTN